MENKYFKILVVVIFMILGGNSVLIAQSGPPAPPDGTNDQNNKLGAIPIDDSIIWFFTLGSLYGIYRVRKKYKLSNTID